MQHPLVLPLEACSDPVLVGGKASGLGWLLRQGFRVPPGVCVTTAAYRSALQEAKFDIRTQWEQVARASETARVSLLDECRRRISTAALPLHVLMELERHLDRLADSEKTLWAVRSSASEEDAEDATFGGLFRTVLGVSRREIAVAVVACWASLWTPPAWIYRSQAGKGRRLSAEPSAMAVVIQPLLVARSAGVAYSRHPITGHADHLVINAVYGVAEPLVSGEAEPDQYVVKVAQREPPSLNVIGRDIAEKTRSRVVGPDSLVDQPVPESLRYSPALGDADIFSLSRLTKQVEKAMKRPVDIEWVLDSQGLWLLQARPIPHLGARADFPAESCTWSRANFRETLPDVPSPLAVALLQEYMETSILRHYREVGCHIPRGLASVRVIRGRPYINVTLMQSLMAQLGGDPAEVTDLMGGEPAPTPPGVVRMRWWRLAWAGLLVERKLLAAPRQAPAWFVEMKRLGLAQLNPALDRLSEPELLERLLLMNRAVRARDLTFALVGGVSQALTALRVTLQRRLKAGWRPLLNAAARGVGTIISAKQILWLTELAEIARRDPSARDFLLAEPWEPNEFRVRLAGTPFLEALDRFLEEYGHRAIGESDVRVPRFAEQPGYVLGVIRGHMLAPRGRSNAAVQHEQALAREAALKEVRRAFGWRLYEWLWFRRWHRILCRSQELREANRHHLMYYLAGVKRLFLLLGQKLAERGLLDVADDLFFLVPDEIRILVGDLPGEQRRDWKSFVATRRAEMARHVAEDASDVATWQPRSTLDSGAALHTGANVSLKGMPISAGYAEGPVRLILSARDIQQVRSGDILVLPVIDPGMAPLMGLAAGLVIEMGGMLSHGAIIAREYGIPALANVRQATRLLKEGERIAVDATAGEVRRLAAQ